MNYSKIGRKIRKIRELELQKTREEFAEEIGISLHTVARLENATTKVNNVEIFLKISEMTGYTIEELLSDKQFSNNAESTKLKIINSLNFLSEDELTYINEYIHNFLKFAHRKDKPILHSADNGTPKN